jgi:hypothetical protein
LFAEFPWVTVSFAVFLALTRRWAPKRFANFKPEDFLNSGSVDIPKKVVGLRKKYPDPKGNPSSGVFVLGAMAKSKGSRSSNTERFIYKKRFSSSTNCCHHKPFFTPGPFFE